MAGNVAGAHAVHRNHHPPTVRSVAVRADSVNLIFAWLRTYLGHLGTGACQLILRGEVSYISSVNLLE